MRHDLQSPANRWAFCFLFQGFAIVRGFFVFVLHTPQPRLPSGAKLSHDDDIYAPLFNGLLSAFLRRLSDYAGCSTRWPQAMIGAFAVSLIWSIKMVVARSALIRAVLVGVATGVLLTGCSGRNVQSQQNVQQVAAPVPPKRVVDVEVDEFTKETSYFGPWTATHDGNTHGNVAGVTASLLATASGKDTAYKIIIVSMRVVPPSEHYLMLSSAIDTDSKTMPLDVFDRTAECGSATCTLSEKAVISVGRKYLQDHATSGLRIRLEGKRGSQVFEVPTADLTLFLSKVPVSEPI
jgi:hypothetical protein